MKNANNQVYIIDGDTSSEGSRANREMKISQMKNTISGLMCMEDISYDQGKFVVLNEVSNDKKIKSSRNEKNEKEGKRADSFESAP